MNKLLVVLLAALLIPVWGCALQVGAVHLALGDTEASSCSGQTDVKADGSYSCVGETEVARGSAISETLGDVLGGVFDLARSLVGGIGAGLASVGHHEDGKQDPPA